jgi:flagellar basal-body rod protein FlgF
MENAIYAALARQSGLRQELQAIAHNIANTSTNGFKRESLVFTEHLVPSVSPNLSVSMAIAGSQTTDWSQGELIQTFGKTDLAIQGEGYFLLETQDGHRLTRNGSFTLSPTGEIVAQDGARLLGEGQAPIGIPLGSGDIGVGSDGVLSVAGSPVAKIGVFRPENLLELQRDAYSRFVPGDDLAAMDDGMIIQGYLEKSNVNPVLEVSRLIEVQRAYENARNFLNSEDDRVKNVLRTLAN